jgi:hypothetical protein
VVERNGDDAFSLAKERAERATLSRLKVREGDIGEGW